MCRHYFCVLILRFDSQRTQLMLYTVNSFKLMIEGFSPTGKDGGGVPSISQKFALPTRTGKILQLSRLHPKTKFLFSLTSHQMSLPPSPTPTKQQFSSYNLITAAFLPVVIAPITFCFNFILLNTQFMLMLILSDVQF